MSPLVALALATPIWGFSLQIHSAPPATLVSSSARLASIEAVPTTVAPDLEAARESRNRTLMDWTRALSVASIGAFAVTGVLGFIQLSDEYGFHARQSETACATGHAVLGYCGESTPWAHLSAALSTATLGLTTFIFSTQIDYDRAARMDSDWRTYEVTRWVGFGLFAAQAVYGFLLANAIRFGWADQANDFETLQALAIGHMALGATTLGVEVANTILLF